MDLNLIVDGVCQDYMLLLMNVLFFYCSWLFDHSVDLAFSWQSGIMVSLVLYTVSRISTLSGLISDIWKGN